ncbi:alkaline phosphatase family protein [Pseudogemmatithrix spongiicola]|uniref:Alkaline phosphatase family protein n=1 Tax=Pseudogemmatithrix spongiicola TaxID=3062599 RepID=A0AA49JUM4_9BACT|nr:alkaline phosphatase family protein [Gemmatimonadaceae bacterium 'strain 138']WKW15184.1 alkaline phosphatase family protein [Gemmatimonadaceae bacterium 'strain 318']
MRRASSAAVTLAALLVALPACAQRAPQTPPSVNAPIAAPTPQGPRPRLVVFLTVDQLRPDYLTRWDSQFTGGFRRLLDEGRFFVNGVHDHAITETAPGHASTMSGRFPYSTGIASNSAGVNTPTAPLLESDGVGASPFRFKGTTLTDWLRAARPDARILSVSRKDRGAILPIGAGKYPVFWYAQRSGKFTTSSYYGDSLPAWVRAFNAEDHAGTRYAGRVWDLLLPVENYPEPDSVQAESAGQEPAFPHALPTDVELARNAIIGYPWMDQMTLDFAWRALREMELGASADRTDLLAVSLSTLDAVGHRWGPDSREVHDHMLRIDRMLGTFLDSLVAVRGRDNVVIALTADHGVAPIPEVRSTWGDNSRASRLTSRELEPVIAGVAPVIRRLELDPTAFNLDWGVLEVDRSKVQGKDAAVRTVAREFARLARRVRGIQRVDVIDDIVRADTVRDNYARRWLHMFRPGGEAIAAITMEPYWLYGGSIATHGSPHDYDAKVPVLFWGAAFAPGRDSSAARVVDMAPTLARLLGVPPLEKLDGIVLDAAFRR